MTLRMVDRAPFLACLGLVLWACASAPIQEMSDARQALEAARRAQAEVLAPVELEEAQRHLMRAEQALEVRDYRRAHREAERAKTHAVAARSLAAELSAARDAVAEAQQAGIPSAEAAAMLEQAEQAAKVGLQEQALSLASRAQASLEQPLQRVYLRKAGDLLDRQERAASLTAPQREQLQRAREAYDRGDGRAALQLLQGFTGQP